MPIVPFRTLRHEFRLVVPGQAAADAFAFMAIAPEIAGAKLVAVDIPVERQHGFYRMQRPDGRVTTGSASRLIGELHGLAFADIQLSEAGAPLVHGATVVGDWGRAALIGAKALGKTTLTLHLIAQGERVEGDEHLVVGEDHVVARPRTVRVKPGSLAFVPALAAAVQRCPSITNWDGSPIYAVDPSIGGIAWRIERGALDHLIFLEANHGGRSVMAPIAAAEALRRLLSQSALPPSGIARAVARLRQLAMTCTAHLLQVGDLDGALWHLRRAGRPTS